MKKVPLTILNGFLGAGKTTLLQHLLKQARHQQLNIGVIVNDMSQLEVDGLLVSHNEPTGPSSNNLISIYSDNISSASGLEKLGQALDMLAGDTALEHIVLETSGSSHPLPLVKYLRKHQRIALKGVFVVVDSVMLHNDYADGSELLPKFQKNLKTGRRDVHNLLVEQVLFCSRLLLSRADRLPAKNVSKIAQAIHPINPGISIMAMVRGNMQLDDLLSQPDYDFHRVAKLIEELETEVASEVSEEYSYALDARVIHDPRPFHPQRLWNVYHEFLGMGIYRSKGFFWMPSRDDLALLWNQAAGSISLEVISYWKSGVLGHADNRLLQEERDELMRQVQSMHPVFGDRRCELTIIGATDQLIPFVTALQNCFLTAEEILYWQSGGYFDDPWPTDVMRIEHL